jgi:hypothetical protein
MGEVIQFVSRSERERMQLIRDARAIYESVFPSADAVSGQRPKMGRAVGDASIHNGGDVQH